MNADELKALQDIRDRIDELLELAEQDHIALFWPSSFRPAYVTQWFRENPAVYAKWGLEGHEGLDIRSGLNGHAICICDGIVSRVDEWPNTGNYGYSIRVDHAVLNLTSIYAHLNPSVKVSPVGSIVSGGQVLGTCDSTGNASGAHLHLSLKNKAGQFIDPMVLLQGVYVEQGGIQILPPLGIPMSLKV